MRALRFHGNKDIRIDDVPVPVLKPGWVKIKNAWCGICGSDLHEYTIGPMNTTETPHALTGESLPSICGHEFAGTVVELGEGVNDIQIDQKVAIFPILGDGTCHWCQTEDYRLCEKWGFLGYSGYGGGMAEYVCVERKACHKIPDHVSLDVASLVEPLAVGWHAVKAAKVGPGDHCLVLGAVSDIGRACHTHIRYLADDLHLGPIGLSVVHCLIAHGVNSMVVSEPSAMRLAHAKAAGATHMINPTQEDVASMCRSISGGHGANAVFECAGLPVAFNTAVDAVAGRGVIVNVAIYETKLVIKAPNLLTRRQITIFGSNTYTRGEFDEVIDAIATGKIKSPENMITARVPLSRAVEDGFMELLSSKGKHVKILVNPGKWQSDVL